MRGFAAALVMVATGAVALAAPDVPTPPASVLDLRVVAGGAATTTLRELVGDAPAVIAFWATWCAPCRAEVPSLNRALETWRPRGLRVIGVALDTNGTQVEDARARWDIRYDVRRLAPGETARAEALFARGLPVTAFVSRGTATLHERMLDDATLDRSVPGLLAPVQ